jgi:hypothetical protein
MLKYALIALILVIAVSTLGCAGVTGYVAEQLPSVQNCQRVEYVREYSVVELKATCDVSRSGTARP